MKHFSFLCAWCVLLFSLVFAPAGSTPSAAPAPLWVTAYYAGWNQDQLKPADIDFAALTHLVHFSVLPRADGTLDTTRHDISAARSAAIVQATHAANRKVLLCIGGANSAPGFRAAITPKMRAAFIKNLLQITNQRGYDGLDIDFEPLEKTDSENYSAFIRELRTALRNSNPALLLTCAVGAQQNWFSLLQNQFDQINLMTYDQSGPWPGWETWHNSSLFTSGLKFKTTDRLLPSTQLQLQQWLNAGFKPGKLGIGLAFYGTLWQGATGPNQGIAGVTVRQISYRQLRRDYFKLERYRWDEKAGAPYLSIDQPGTANDFFISYDDEKLAQMKINFAREKGLGGVIIWELGSAFRPESPAGERDNLLQAVKQAAFPIPATPKKAAVKRGFPAAAPWVSCYGSAKDMGDLDKVAQTFRIINIDADPDIGNFTPAQIAQLKNGGRNRVISYLNVGSCETFRSYWKKVPAGFLAARDNRAAHAGAYEGYADETWMNPGNADYQKLLLDYIAPRLVAQGVDGFFLDNMEIVEHAADDKNGACDAACSQGGLDFVRKLREKYPNLLIVMQNATSDVTRKGITGGIAFPTLLDGIAHEEVYAPKPDKYAEAELLAWKALNLKPGGRPFWIGTEDYVRSAANIEKARRVYEKSRANGFSPYVADASANQQTVFYWPF